MADTIYISQDLGESLKRFDYKIRSTERNIVPLDFTMSYRLRCLLNHTANSQIWRHENDDGPSRP